jgi:tRNA 2-thiouridine synthesizing protein A
MKKINAVGLRCPEPLMIVRRELRNMSPGEAIEITADDPSTERDFDLLCRNLGYVMEEHKAESADNSALYFFVIRKP